jgi:hypothetical protein
MELTSAQIEKAFKVLEKEQQSNLLTKRRKLIVLGLNICVYGFLLTFLWSLIPGSESDLLYGILGFFAIMIPVFFLFSLPLIIKLLRFNRLIRKLGLKDIISAPWKRAKNQTRVSGILALIIAWIGGIFILTGLILLEDLFSGLAFCFIGISFLSIHFIWRNKFKLEIVSQLQTALSRYKGVSEEKNEDTKYKISQEDYDLIARIEKAQISSDQTESIIANYNEPASSYYSIQKSRDFRDTLNKLEPDIRLAVEDHIDDLAVSTKSSDAQKKQQLDILNFKIPGNHVEISYQIDDSKNQIKLISLKKVNGS